MHPGDKRVCGRASLALHALAVGSAEGKAAVVAAGAAPLLAAAARAFAHEGAGKETFADALAALGFGADGLRA